MNDKIQQAYINGQIARQNGLTEKDNPYYANTPQFEAWLKGFNGDPCDIEA